MVYLQAADQAGPGQDRGGTEQEGRAETITYKAGIDCSEPEQTQDWLGEAVSNHPLWKKIKLLAVAKNIVVSNKQVNKTAEEFFRDLPVDLTVEDMWPTSRQALKLMGVEPDETLAQWCAQMIRI